MRISQNSTLRTCPTCATLFDLEASPHRPFCSQRCQELDLSRWLGEGYSLPLDVDEIDEPGEEDPLADDA